MNFTGYVLYTDGGCRPNPNGHGGAGIHGYRWSTGGGTRGIGHTSHAATVHGYEPKAQAAEFASKSAPEATLADADKMATWLESNKKAKVAIDCYYDLSIPIALGASNNLAELMAAARSLEYIKEDAIEQEAKQVIIRADSMYVINGFTNNLQNWISNNFIKSDGQPVKNSEEWTQLWSVAQDYYKAGITITFEHVKGHGDCIGNNNADWLATTAVMKSKSFKLDAFYSEVPGQGYWKTGTDERHPFMALRYGYFNTEEGSHVPGTYMTGSQGKVVELIGKKVSGSMFGLIRLAQPIEMIESIIKKQKSLPSEIDYFSLLDFDNMYGGQFRYLNMVGGDYLYCQESHRKDLYTPNKDRVTTELNPAYLASRTQDVMNVLEDVLAHYKKGDDIIVVNDITDTFYDVTEEKVKVKKGEPEQTKQVCKLKPSIVVGYSVHPLDVKYHTSTFEIKNIDLKLTLGIDMPERNALKRLEDTMPKVCLVTWSVGPGVFLYATIIESGEDVGIWSGAYSNMRVTPEALDTVEKHKGSKKNE